MKTIHVKHLGNRDQRNPSSVRKIVHRFTLGLGGLLIVLLLTSGISAVINSSLPTHSEVVDHLSNLETARLAEFFHLKRELGSSIWSGWGEADIPVILYNEGYAFLVGYPDPPPGWLKMPQRESRGAAWEVIPDDKFDSMPYYRQRLTDPNKTPEGFTVLVGDRWVATFQTREYSEISFYSGLREEFPPVVREIIPYSLFWNLISGESDAYLAFLLHEAFHAYQGSLSPDLFAQAEEVMRLENRYPWEDPVHLDAWQKELDLLVEAANATSNEEAAELVRQFLAQRDARRTKLGLSSELVDFERRREWLEGLAKYTELAIGRMAATTPGYEPLPDMHADPEFNDYRSRDHFWSLQLNQVRQVLKNEGEVRFYYSGFAQAILLDRLLPSWRTSVISEGTPLEELLQDAISQY
ncbi:MAG TPA: hypothetical protein VK206_25440 [Anaerolineales bacterium]|nr:hypothetical protein [Anaerolineales bacterium]